MLGHIIFVASLLSVVVDGSPAPAQLARVAKAAGCSNGGEIVSDWDVLGELQPSGIPEPVRDSEAMSCLLKSWYSSSKHVGVNAGLGNIKEAVYGEILPEGLNKVFRTVGNMGANINSDDTFVDLGSGAGKSVLQAHLMTPASRVVGVELSAMHHQNAVSALGKMVEDGAQDDSRKIDFINGDIRKYSDWSDGTVVFFNNLCFDADKLLPFAWDLPKTLQPGSMLVVTKQLPGCHPGVILTQSMTFKTSWSHSLNNGKDGANAYVYMVAPSVLRPDVQWLVPDEELQASSSNILVGEAADVQRNPEDLLSPSALAEIGNQLGMRRSPLHRFGVLVGATKGAVAGNFKEVAVDWNSKPSVETFPWSEVVSTSLGAVNHGDSFECVVKDIGAATPYLSYQQKWVKPQPDDRSPPALLGQILNNIKDVNYPNPSDKETLLHLAVGRGFHGVFPVSSDALLEGLLENRADIHQKDSQGKTPLHAAAKQTDDLATMASLVKNRADVNAQDDDGRTPLHEAIRGAEDSDTTALLIHVRADPMLADSWGKTPLHVAAKYGHAPVAELLLGNKVRVEARDNFGRTPLHDAAEGNHREMAELLLEHGANPKTKDDYGMLPW